MAFVATKLAFFNLIFLVHLFIRPSFQLQREVDFPVIDSSNFRYQYYSMKKNRRFPYETIKRVQVYDELACVQHCTRRKSLCLSVNFKKQAEDGLHLCEIRLVDEVRFKPYGLEEDKEFNHMSPMIFSYRSCAEVPRKISGVYHIHPISPHSVPVFCDMTTTEGGWTVIQKRIDGSVNFYRNWDDYKWGFGNKFGELGEYWLGLENIHAMTSQRSYRLIFDLENFKGKTRYAEYSYILVSSEADNYRVTIGTYSGTAGDSFSSFHNGMQFTTKDHDNDLSGNRNCAVEYTGAWWYSSCHESNPNGQYLSGPGTSHAQGINWFTWLGHGYSLKRVEIKIRPL